MNDLLRFQKGELETIVLEKDDANQTEKDLEAGSIHGSNNSEDQGLSLFFQQVETIKDEMEKIHELLKKLQEENKESKSVTKASAMKVLKEKMESDVDKVTKIARGIKEKLEKLDQDNLANRTKQGCEEGTSTDRTRTSMTMTLKNKLKELMGEFQV